ncbi:hypothetical protein HQN90_11020 [Paenibacillus alba]|uniref:hypothetical protein n=1 Tax=Paenibacillus alba TaxID=1197127 RepID=UPI00156360F1|nr:hypothetical protein [Paenibacillus alba]NQX66658.1 hypothetical protein [Paenibacillus alba]
MEKTSFVGVPNSFYNKELLKPREFYLYCYLNASRSFLTENTVKTNIDLLIEEIKFVKKRQDNKDAIVESLNSLHEKGMLIFEYQDIRKDKKLEISFRKLSLEKGFEKIPYKYFELTYDPEEFMTICAIKTFKRQISFAEFGSILSCSERHVKDLIPKMEQKGILNINNGKYYVNENNQLRQETNSYSINEDHFVGENQQDQQNQESQTGGDKKKHLIQSETRANNWGVKGKNLIDNDYYIYLTSSDDKFIRMVENIINVLKNPKDPSKKPFDFTKMEKAAKERIQKENKKEMLEKSLNLVRLKGIKDLVPVTSEIIDNIDFSSVEKVVFLSKQNKREEVQLDRLAGNNPTTNALKLIVDMYKNVVRENIVFDYEQAIEIRNRIKEMNEKIA